MSRSDGDRASVDRDWAEALAPNRRGLLGASLLAGLASGPALAAPAAKVSPWGADTWKQATPAPISVRPGEETLPARPRAFTDIESYHAHIYFDEDTYQKAALIRRWAAERFEVELGDWNLEPRGPHVTPSFYFGFANEQLSTIVPWLQLNSLGLTILLHPNTDDPRADHLYYALWVNRSQPVNAYGMKRPGPGQPPVEQIIPNTVPSVTLERG
ncbi:DOPA 4,5-dioxygenase family protein [Caulobacter segnis]|uniref:DOPA 4,5-dioxygenase family protein n=1 Tax=Caulobacter segnis TaxID=88688 RepID=UPI0024104E95|nr:DOPA 4,5-dioxygenase family protein [Caulobacter segnis]MDG2522534.1 DOPA 4,5-dioxygenase family protein [Caulobacter segnis]